MLVFFLLTGLLVLSCAGYPAYDAAEQTRADNEETRQNLREFILMRPEYTQADQRDKRFFWGSPRKSQANR